MSANIVIYSKWLCPYCMMAKRLFKNKGVKYTEISVSLSKKRWNEMVQKSGGISLVTTVPQIFINEEPLGGYDDIATLDQEGILDQKLGIN